MIQLIIKTGKAFFRALGYYPATIRGIKFKCDPYNIALWHAIGHGRWEPDLYNIMDKYLNADSTYVDIGAWVGPTVLYAAKKSKQVYCFEPDYVAYEHLLSNIRLNKLKNVFPFNFAVSSFNGIRRVGSFNGVIGQSMTSLLDTGEQADTIDICCINWAQWVELVGLKGVDFIKIDIEGGEFKLLPAMKEYLMQYKPIVHLSFHTPFLHQDLRVKSLTQVLDVLSIYRHCFDEKMDAADIEKLAEKELLEHFRSLLFIA